VTFPLLLLLDLLVLDPVELFGRAALVLGDTQRARDRELTKWLGSTEGHRPGDAGEGAHIYGGFGGLGVAVNTVHPRRLDRETYYVICNWPGPSIVNLWCIVVVLCSRVEINGRRELSQTKQA